MRTLTSFIVAVASVVWSVPPAWSDTFTFSVEAAPIFAMADGSASQTGTYQTIYSAALPIPTTTLYIANTGPLADLNGSPPHNYGFDYYVKTQTGAFGSDKQLVINLEGTVIGGQGGLLDIINNSIKWNGSQAPPAGLVHYSDQYRIGLYNMSFPSAPTVLTNSRLQYHILETNFDPGTQLIPAAQWSNITEDDGTVPIVQTSFDASGLDAFFDFPGGLWAYNSGLEDTALRMVMFYQGEYPGGGTGPQPTVPEPGSVALLLTALTFIGAIEARRRER